MTFLKDKMKGFSLVEVILSVSLFALILTTAGSSFWYGQENSIVAGHRGRAVLLAEEGLEAVRNIRDNDFSNLVNGTYQIDNSGGSWELIAGTETIGIFERTVTISTIDTNIKEVTVAIDWRQTLQREGSLEIAEQFTNWQGPSTPLPITNCGDYCISLLYFSGSCKASLGLCKYIHEPEGDVHCLVSKPICCCRP